MAEQYSIRLANIEDMKNVFDLSNDNIVRQNSIHREKIEWENHVEWFKHKLNDKNCVFYIIEDKNKNFIGQTRIDKKNDENIISISISKDFRGNGLSTKIIKECSDKTKFNEIVAYIKKDNIASQKAFQKAGYVFADENDDGLLKFEYLRKN